MARWAIWILASALVTLVLIWGGLHFLIVPRIAEFRPWLEQQASQRMGITVKVGDILATSNGLIPSVELRDVRLLDADGREALHLPSVLAALSVRSVLSRSFEQLYVAAPELDVRRSADGRIWIAGFALPESSAGNSSAAADWVFSQPELVVRHGRVRWTDELRGLPALELEDVDVLVRSRHLSHSLRVDADPPAGWGARLSVQGTFQHPLFSAHRGDWRNWKGELFAQATQVDLAQLRNYVDLGVDLSQGAGSLRAWVDVDHAAVQGATADLALQAVSVRLAPQLEPLDLERVNGRLALRQIDGGREITSQGLRFETGDGLLWPGGNVRLSLYDARRTTPAHGALEADRLDLAAMQEIAKRLPLQAHLGDLIQRLSPQGQVEKLALSWQGEGANPSSYSATGQVSQLALAAQPPLSQAQDALGIPGVRGARVDFSLNQDGGHATVDVQGGSVEFPGVFERPVLAFDSLGGDIQWKLDGNHISLETSKLRFANTDVQGEANIKWQTAAGAQRFPGVLDLSGSLSRANLAALPRYLPRAMNQAARDYLAQALVAGESSSAKFRVKGDLAKFPFSSAKQGELQISGQFSNTSYAYAPPMVMPPDSLPWPLLTQVSGDMLLDHDSLQIKATRGLLSAGTGLQLGKTEVTISNLFQAPVVHVAADARGPLSEALAFVNASPVSGWIGNALAHTSVSGLADYKIKLAIPVEHAEKTTVQGNVLLSGNDFQFAPGLPRLSRARGQVSFSESGFAVSGLQARSLGGDVRAEGGINFGNGAGARTAPGSLRLSGVATAEGLRQASELGLGARLAQFTTGSTAYNATLALKGGVPELQITSSLSGLALNLPAPFSKPAEATLPLKLESTVVRGSQASGARLQDQLQMELGRLATVTYVRDIAGAEPKVLRGAISVGQTDEPAALPPDGVAARLRMNQLDVDAWTAVLSRLQHGAGGANTAAALSDATAQSYVPNSLSLRTGELLVNGRSFKQLQLNLNNDGLAWRGNVEASELNGYVEYRQSTGTTPGRVYARLAHLVLAQAGAQDMENLLDQQPASIPALDVVVDDFELQGKKLGRVDILAVNLGGTRDGVREWRLSRFNISTPEATLTATGNWAQVNAQSGQAPAAGVRERRRTALNFKLDINDSGELLKRMGMAGVIAKGRGLVQGQVSWLGSPFSPDYPSMGGSLNVNVESGQFLKAEPGIAKLLGVLSLQSLPRRLTLDFRDVFSDGFSFDFLRGDVAIDKGIARTSNLQMKGVNAAVLMEGQADIAKETQSLKVVVIPEINVASASLLYSAINPLVGLTTFLANVILRKPLIDANTQEFLVDGTWVDPRVTKLERKPEPAAPSK